jgi:hypothetical protein
MLNAEIVRQGYGHAYTQFPFKFLDRFRDYETEARAARRGLWREADEVVYITRSGQKYHRAGCRELTPTRTAVSMRSVGRRAPCSVCKPPARTE